MSVVGLGDAEGSQFWSRAVWGRQNVERDVRGGFQCGIVEKRGPSLGDLGQWSPTFLAPGTGAPLRI